MGGLASSFSLTEKSVPRERNYDENTQTGILTSGFEPLFRLPKNSNPQWLWKFVSCYSGATVPDFHGVPRRLDADGGMPRARHFKERYRITLGKTRWQDL
jgi:hypothetical protein